MLSSKAIIALGEKRRAERFPCGHPRVAENQVAVGVGNGVRCRICRRAIAAKSGRKVRGTV